MDTGQLQDNYSKKIIALHKEKKKAKNLLNVARSDEGVAILSRYIKTCRNEIRMLRMEYVVNLHKHRELNVYLPNAKFTAEAYDYYINYGSGILSPPKSYFEFVETMRRLNKRNGNGKLGTNNNLGRFFSNDSEN